MVSLRRRKLLGLCSGKHSFPVEVPSPAEIGNVVGNVNFNGKLLSVHPLPSAELSHLEPIKVYEAHIQSSNASVSSSSKEELNHYFPGKKIKRRKRHRRKHYEDQEPCLMRGVYYKNMKWQAAIKVDKKQIHLGTVGSQEEAARLYDRAAFMCGREPNFELSEEEKQELSQYKWEEFLAVARNNITNKRQQRGRQKKPETHLQNSDWDDGRGIIGVIPMSDDEDEENSV